MAAPWSEGFELRIKGKIHQQDCIQVQNYATNLQVHDPTELNQFLKDLCNAMLECLTGNLLNAVSQDYTLVGVEAVRTYPTPSDPQFVAAPGGSVGSQATTNVSFAGVQINIRSGIGGKSGRGRNFWPPPGDDRMTQSVLAVTGIPPFEVFVLCVVGKFIGGGKSTPFSLGVLSKKKVNGALPAFDERFREAISMDVEPKIAKVGSRKVGRGS